MTGFAFTQRESKLLRLILNRGASIGEVHNAAAKLAESLRGRQMTAEAIELVLRSAPSATDGSPLKYSRPDFGLCTMPFGKHRGKAFSEISPSYFDWLLRAIRSNPHGPAYQVKVAEEIEQFLAQ